MYGIDRTSDNLFCVMSLASNSSFSTSPECVAILFMLVIHVCQSCKGKDFISNSQAKRTPFCREGENLQALLLQNAKCKMQRSEGRAESSLSGYAERRMLSTKVKCKGARAEPKARSPAAHLGKRCKVTALEMRTERKIRRVKVW